MPLPKPSKSEKQSEFIQRCMTDDVMLKEYPNKIKGQQYALIFTGINDRK